MSDYRTPTSQMWKRIIQLATLGMYDEIYDGASKGETQLKLIEKCISDIRNMSSRKIKQPIRKAVKNAKIKP